MIFVLCARYFFVRSVTHFGVRNQTVLKRAVVLSSVYYAFALKYRCLATFTTNDVT